MLVSSSLGGKGTMYISDFGGDFGGFILSEKNSALPVSEVLWQALCSALWPVLLGELAVGSPVNMEPGQGQPLTHFALPTAV